jgi:hypothetical protein
MDSYNLRSRQVVKTFQANTSPKYEYIKILKRDLTHHGYTWKPESIHHLPENIPFTRECAEGGLYVCEPKHFFEWIDLYQDVAWVSYASIPDQAEKQVFPTKIKASSVVLHGPLISLEDFIPLAVKAGADVHAWNDEALRLASYYGHVAVVECLLKAGADVHAGEDQALRYASENGHVAAVECLLKAGANVHAQEDYALQWASRNGHVAVVECLLKAGADVHARGDEALQWASRNGHVAVVKLLKQYM